MQVSAVQLEVTDKQAPQDRVAAAEKAVREEADRGADLVLLPEMWLPGFFGFDQYEQLAEPLDGPTVQHFSKLAADVGAVLLAGSFVERGETGLHNTTVVFDAEGATLATYRKMHLFAYGSREAELLQRGDELVTFTALGMTFGVSTCYDVRFPEMYRQLVDRGAEAFLIVAGWPFPRVDAWRTLCRARAIENQAPVIGCNTSGRQGPATFAGASVAYDQWGTPLGQLDDRPGVLRREIDPEGVRATRREFAVLEHRVL